LKAFLLLFHIQPKQKRGGGCRAEELRALGSGQANSLFLHFSLTDSIHKMALCPGWACNLLNSFYWPTCKRGMEWNGGDCRLQLRRIVII